MNNIIYLWKFKPNEKKYFPQDVVINNLKYIENYKIINNPSIIESFIINSNHIFPDLLQLYTSITTLTQFSYTLILICNHFHILIMTVILFH